MLSEFRSISNHVLRGLQLSIVIGSCVTLVASMTIAADGDLDTSFSSDGKYRYDMGSFDDHGYGMALGPDGTIYVVGVSGNANDDIGVSRLTAAGALDPSFNGTGRRVINYVWGNDEARDVAVQADGKIVVVGSSFIDTLDNFVVLRLNNNGSYDTSFNSLGYHHINFSHDSFARAVAIQSDGKIVVVGFVDQSFASDVDIAIARFNANGSLDTSFSGDGMQTFDTAWGWAEAWDVAIQPDGKILVAGWAQVDTLREFIVLRYNSNGSLDTSFNTFGYTGVNFGSDSLGRAMVIQPDGKIVVAGTVEQTIDKDIAVARFNSNGSLDTSFSGDGRQTYDGSWGWDEGWGVALQEDGKIVVAGSATVDTIIDLWVLRYTTAGVLDTSFGGFGYAGTHFGTDTFGRAVAIQPDGKIVVAGYDEVPPYDSFAIVRFEGDSTLIFADGFESGNSMFWSSTVP